MSRSRWHKILILSGCAVGSLLAFIAWYYFNVAQPAVAMSAAPVPNTLVGYVWTALGGLATLGFSGATVWQFILSVLEAHKDELASALKEGGASETVVKSGIKFLHISRIMADIANTPPGPTRDLLVKAGVAACDELKASLFGADGKSIGN